MTTAPIAMAGSGSTEIEVERILADSRTKEFKDLRDRSAYMYITGTHPSHLRTFFTRALSLVSRMHNRPVSLDGRSGNLKLDERVVQKLDLDNHPMVQKVREYIAEGYRITVSRGANNRKPYTKIFMSKGNDEITVQIDGSVLDHWG